jgi:Na+/H+ antiporter NhaD/arsenite permease-like protein
MHRIDGEDRVRVSGAGAHFGGDPAKSPELAEIGGWPEVGPRAAEPSLCFLPFSSRMSTGVHAASRSGTGQCAGRAAARYPLATMKRHLEIPCAQYFARRAPSVARHFVGAETIGRTARMSCTPVRRFAFALLLAGSSAAEAAGTAPALLGVPVDFFLFALTLLGVALFHHHTLQVALIGLAIIVLYKLGFTGFETGPGFAGFIRHMEHEWVILTNLLCLLVGFALLSNHFEQSHLPQVLPRFLPDDWKGCFALLALVFVLSGCLDNIAAALIGGTVAAKVFRGKVHIGYLAAIVAASNAGGAGSVVGDTTTTMMWLGGVSPLKVLDAYIAAVVALVVFGVPASLQQQRHAPIMKHQARHVTVDWPRVTIVALILVAAIVANVAVNLRFMDLIGNFPAIGVAIWAVILACAPWRRPQWKLVPAAFNASIFLLALVTCASLMPVEKLPAASWQSSLALGFISSVFDNIPLTALALKQGGYDWGLLAYAVGFGGSMIWFGSSAGVALAAVYPEARSIGLWLRHGWHVAIAYVVGFLLMLALTGWHPDATALTS